jgi:regulator of protease activity HflC (stomatin/prohibitin superfamily)
MQIKHTFLITALLSSLSIGVQAQPNAAALDRLGLDDDQKAKVQTILSTQGDKYRELFDAEREVMRAKQDAQREAMRAKMEAEREAMSAHRDAMKTKFDAIQADTINQLGSVLNEEQLAEATKMIERTQKQMADRMMSNRQEQGPMFGPQMNNRQQDKGMPQQNFRR